MSATITDTLKFSLMDKIHDDYHSLGRALGDSDYFYIAIGKSEEWPNDSDVLVPIDGSPSQERNFRLSMQSFKRINDVSFVLTRRNWSSGSIYSPYDDTNYAGRPLDTVAGRYPFYVLTDENNVYICLKQGKTSQGIAVPSSVRPEDVTGLAFETADGYVWKYLYNIGSFEANRFLSSNFMPVQNVDSDTAVTPAETNQVEIKKLSTPGQILGIAIDSAGIGYTTAPSITINGNGQNAIASCIVSGGRIVDVFMKDSANATFSESNLGSGYSYAGISLSSGNASLRAILPNEKNGLGFDPRKDLQSRGMIFNVKTEGTENGDFFVDQSFRQVGLIKNPLRDSSSFVGFVGDSAFTSPTGISLNYLQFDSGSSFTSPEGETITGQSSTAVAYVDKWFPTSRRMYFHQTQETGFVSFSEGEVVQASNASGSGVLDSAGVDADSRAYGITDIDKFSGELFYIDNRAAIVRDADQTEDIKIVIQL